ncbi:hypothetical protein VNI00_002453 [Paramarasmius palmivorus]|uniref:Endonuclease/exonuclease/phosphatase domain-containing protein n=1 Tax=Paramarasmius palmivorus TaxID=297713 RepID=A0AAW0DZZ3_9AGAR
MSWTGLDVSIIIYANASDARRHQACCQSDGADSPTLILVPLPMHMDLAAYGLAHLVAFLPILELQAYGERLMNKLYSWLFWSALVSVSTSTSVTDIQGSTWRSPYAGLRVSNVSGIVTAKGPDGFFIAGDRVVDLRVSNGLYVFGSSAVGRVNVGDKVTLGGTVSEFRSSSSPNDLFITELLPNISSITILSSNNTFTPIVLGKDRIPPTQYLSPLDVGKDSFLSVPNNVSRIETVNATLDPFKYGLDFWESLEGQLVVIPKPVALDFPNRFGDFWVHGDWPISARNSRGGLTMSFGADGIVNGGSEAIVIGTPLDGTKNPSVAVGTSVSDIVGVVTYQFGFFRVLPLTAPEVVSTLDVTVPPSTLTSVQDSCVITVGDYNVENMAPTSSHIPSVADHIANYLNSPDILFVQEIQDNSGPTNDGTVSANLTLTALAKAIAAAGNVTYDFVEVEPVDGQDGGQPGGNIRQAFLYRPEKLSLVPGSPAGGPLDGVQVIDGSGKGSSTLSFNPGRIDPNNTAWTASRKPLVAEWQTSEGATLFTVNLHLSSKGGSSSTHGDARPPVNSPIEQRTLQMDTISTFLRSLLDHDYDANIVVAGDFNEFVHTRSVFKTFETMMTEVDELAGVPPAERYTYVFDQFSEQLDHIFVSNAVGRRLVEAEHVHVNNWSPSLDVRISDHDPTVARIRVC